MPELILLYVIGLLNNNGKITAIALSRILGNVSHDKLTRLLYKKWDEQMTLYYCMMNL